MGAKLTPAQQKLREIPVKEQYLPETEPAKTYARQKIQQQIRAYRITRSVLLAPVGKREQAVERAAKDWGFQRKSWVERIIRRGISGAGLPAYQAAEVKVLAMRRVGDVETNYTAIMAELDRQIAKIDQMRDSGADSVPVEMIEHVDGRGTTTTDKKIPIDEAILRLYERKNDYRRAEADTLKFYRGATEEELRDGEGSVTMKFRGTAKFLDELAQIKREREEMTEVVSEQESDGT